MTTPNISLEDLSKLGYKIYCEDLKEVLEKSYYGQYAVIDVEQKKYQVDADRLVAIEKARKEFGDKLFYIVQIGSLQNTCLNYSAQKYAWNF